MVLTALVLYLDIREKHGHELSSISQQVLKFCLIYANSPDILYFSKEIKRYLFTVHVCTQIFK
jgi:hypothetical protein